MAYQDMTITKIRHPEYQDSSQDWEFWRDTYKSGRRYVQKYLYQFTNRENQNNFLNRQRITPPPAFAKSAINDIVNNIFQRMVDIIRVAGPESYMNCLDGKNGGVDLLGNSMNYFIGMKVLPELLTIRKVGVYIDMPSVSGVTLLDVKAQNIRPYLYCYTAEEICNWQNDWNDDPNEYRSLLLKEDYYRVDPRFMMPVDMAQRWRYMYIGDDGFVHVEFYDAEDDRIDANGTRVGLDDPGITLPLRRIPFVMFELPHSLLEDAAPYQLALLNMESSDISYCLMANYPFYIEQQDFRAGSKHLRPEGSGSIPAEGTSDGANEASDQEIEIGVANGRVYGEGLNPPSFINPSSEPLKASMEKQEQMKATIRQLVNLAVTQLNPDKQASAESKGMDNQGLEAGLSAIGICLERGERRVAGFWAEYVNSLPATVNYPARYSLKSDAERREEGKELTALIPTIPSKTCQKEIAKLAARTLLATKVPKDTMDKVENEIEQADVIAVDPATIIQDVMNGIVDKETASKARLYPAGAVGKASQEVIDRATAIAKAQGINKTANPGSRGVPDLSADPSADARDEKAQSRDTTNDPVPQDKTRGNGKENADG